MSRNIAICNQKGGTGKTTSAINIAAYLALSGRKTLLIDLDPQANATSGVGVNTEGIERNIYHVLLDQASIEETIIDSSIPNLHVCPSARELTGAQIELVGMMAREFRLTKAVEKVADQFEFIIFDCPPSLGLLTLNALCAAHSVIVPLQCEYYALEGLSHLVNTIQLVKDNLNPRLEVDGILLTMADYRTNLTHEVIAETRNFFVERENKLKVFDTVIPRNVRLSEAPSFGKPIVLYDKHSLGAKKYEQLCQEYLGIDIPEVDSDETNKTEGVPQQDEVKDGEESLR